jgi:hypothetical protein
VAKALLEATPGTTVYLLGGTYTERLILQKSGTAEAPVTLAAYPGHTAVFDGSGEPDNGQPLISTGGQNHIRLSGLVIQNCLAPGHVGLHIDHSTDVRVTYCVTSNTGGSGMKVGDGSSHVVVAYNEITRACQRGGEESLTLARSTHLDVHHNHVHHTGHEGIDAKAGVAHARIHHNHVHHVARQGLYADAWDVPTYDIVFDSNVVHDCMFGIAACSENGGELRDVTFSNNTVFDCRGPALVIADWGVKAASHAVRDVRFINNTCVNNGGAEWGGGVRLEHPDAEDILVRDNIFAGNTHAQIDVRKPPKSLVISNNLLSGPTVTTGDRAIAADPGFVNPSLNDFRLRDDSPARRRAQGGTDLGASSAPVP